MPITILVVPPKAAGAVYGPEKIKFGSAEIEGEGEGFERVIMVPRFCAPELVAQGCTWPTLEMAEQTIDVLGELAGADYHELHIFLNSRGISEHYWDKNTHGESQNLQRLGELLEQHKDSLPPEIAAFVHRDLEIPLPSGEVRHIRHNFMHALAEHLDQTHQKSRGPGRTAYFSQDEARELALAIYDAERKAGSYLHPETYQDMRNKFLDAKLKSERARDGNDILVRAMDPTPIEPPTR
jgi:hypothetical protein